MLVMIIMIPEGENSDIRLIRFFLECFRKGFNEINLLINCSSFLFKYGSLDWKNFNVRLLE